VGSSLSIGRSKTRCVVFSSTGYFQSSQINLPCKQLSKNACLDQRASTKVWKITRVSTPDCRRGLAHYWVTTFYIPSVPFIIYAYRSKCSSRNCTGSQTLYSTYRSRGTFPSRGHAKLTLVGSTGSCTYYSLVARAFSCAWGLLGMP
jgi:hypothetical protein